MSDNSLREILLNFASRTSLRGIPQIVKAEGRLRHMWLFFVSALFIGCMVNLHQIVSQFLDFDTIQQPKSKYDDSATFPSFTVCNQNPLSDEGRDLIAARGWPTPRQFWRRVRDTIIKNRRQVGDNPYLSSIFSNLHYWHNLPNRSFDFTQLGHRVKQLVTRCYALVLQPDADPPVGHKVCTDAGQWRRIVHPDHLNCYMYILRPEFVSKVIYVEMQIYLGYSTEAQCIDCFTQNINTQTWGARLVLHEQNAFPDITKNGFNVLPGTFTEVKIVPNAWHRLEPPWGDCRQELPTRVGVGGEDGGEFAYNSKLCDSIKRQEKIVKICGCFTSALPVPVATQSNSSISACEQFASITNFTIADLSRAADASRCLANIMHDSGFLGSNKQGHKSRHGHLEACGEPCFRYTYETSVSQAAWPRHSFYLDFAHLLRQKEIQHIRKHYRELRRKIKSSNGSQRVEAIAELHRSEEIKRSFLAVKIAKKDHIVRVIEEKQVRTLPSTLSQVGGLLSMWIGLTLIWIVEVIDLFVRIVGRVCCSGKYEEVVQMRAAADASAASDGAAGAKQKSDSPAECVTSF